MGWETVSGIAAIVTATGVIGVFLQVKVASESIKVASESIKVAIKSMEADHERSRREKTVDLLFQWSAGMQKHNSLARKIVESLDSQQCLDLYQENQVSILIKHEVALNEIFENKGPFENKDDKMITLTVAQVVELRWQVLSYLNSLESVLVAWQSRIVDPETFERQFSFMFNKQEGQNALQNFRDAAGGEQSFPAITEFEERIREINKDLKPERKENVA